LQETYDDNNQMKQNGIKVVNIKQNYDSNNDFKNLNQIRVEFVKVRGYLLIKSVANASTDAVT
jgi:hypothetical protein